MPDQFVAAEGLVVGGTVEVKRLTDAEIKRQLLGTAHRVRCGAHRDLRFQVNSQRTGGSWQRRTGGTWRKLASWPELPSVDALRVLQQLRVREAAGEVASADHFTEVGKLLEWYADRVSRNRSLSKKRRQGVASMIGRRLLPALGSLAITDVSRKELDERFVWPQQEQVSVSYLRACMQVLSMAFAQAHKLNLLAENPMTGMRFVDFVSARVKPKAGRLSMHDLQDLVAMLAERFASDPVPAMLALLMLCHGTRIGETRNAQWSQFCLIRKQWIIPAQNTKTREEHVLPLTEQVCELLRQFKASGKSGERFLFVERVSRKAMSESMALMHFRKLGKGEWTSHDLRKLARTGWVELGVDYLIGEMLLNHKMGFSAETYINTSAENMKLDALQRWHDLLSDSGMAVIWGGMNTEKDGMPKP